MRKHHYLLDKRDELLWALAQQEYTPAQLQIIFNLKHLSTVTRAIERMPNGWRSPWVKRKNYEQ